MTKGTQARAEARALLSAIPVTSVSLGAAAGAMIGLALGGAYLAGGMAQDAVTHSRVAKLADAAATGFSQDTLRQMTRNDPGALSVALRYDPNLMTGYAERQTVEQTAELAAQLDRKSIEGGSHNYNTQLAGRGSKSPFIMRASYNPAALPYQTGALDQSRQLDCLTQAVYYEARGETPAGQAAVAQVVLNRVRHPAYPKSVCGVVFQGAQLGRGCQFSFACDGSMRRGRESAAWRRAAKVAERAMGGHVMAEVGNSTHFHVNSINPSWGARLVRVGSIGMHVFYRFGGRSGAPGAFNATPRDEPAPQAILASLTTPTPVETSASATVANTAATMVGAVMHIDAPTAAVAAPSKTETPATPRTPVKAESADRAASDAAGKSSDS